MTRGVKRSVLSVLVTATLAALGCDGGNGGEVQTAAMRGEKVYRNVCSVCHGADPNEDGVLGPAIAGASEELVRARVVHGNYPPGYTPKRNTQQMVALPHLEPVVPDLVAYPESVKR